MPVWCASGCSAGRTRRFQARRLSVPSSAMQQDYRTLGKQVVFFPSGTFCKGSQQLAPGTAFGGEFGFIAGDRRHRLVIRDSLQRDRPL